MYASEIIDLTKKKNLTEIRAKDIMRKRFTKLSKSFSLEKAILLLAQDGTSGAPIIDANNKLIGFISESDLLLQVSYKSKNEVIQYREKVHSINEMMNLKDIVLFMSQNKLKVSPVIDETNEVIGEITRMDLLKYIINFKD